MPDEDHRRRPDADRRLRQAVRFSRVLRVLELIQGHGRYGVKEIAAELECSERTVFRDLAVLELAGVPWYYDEDDRGYRVRPGYHFPAVNLTDDDLIGQATAASLTASPGLDVTNGAGPTTRKLRGKSTESAARLLTLAEEVTSVIDLKLADHSRHREMIRSIQWALIRGHRLSGTYASPYQPRPKRLELHPYRLCLAKQAWYLIARPDDDRHPRTYRVIRFKSLRPLDAPSEVPADFDLMSYFGNAWSVYRGDQTYQVEVRFIREAADLVTETTWHTTQETERHPDGEVTLTFQVDGLDEIVHWVLCWSGRVRVIRPPELRQRVLDQHRAALVLNEGASV